MSAWEAIVLASGGGAGALVRHALHLAVPARFPWATLGVNVAGSLLLGFALIAFGAEFAGPERFLVGFCGGFTTFSSFAHGTLALHRERSTAQAAANVLSNLVGAVGAFLLGGALGAGLVRDGAPHGVPGNDACAAAVTATFPVAPGRTPVAPCLDARD